MTTARTASSRRACSSAPWTPSCTSRFSAFRTSGRFSVIVSTPPSRVTSTTATATTIIGAVDHYAAFPSLDLDRPAPHVLRLTLRAKGRLNAVSGTMHRELAEVWNAVATDDDTR